MRNFICVIWVIIFIVYYVDGVIKSFDIYKVSINCKNECFGDELDQYKRYGKVCYCNGDEYDVFYYLGEWFYYRVDFVINS